MITQELIIQKLNEFGITNKLEQAYFLGQCAHESGGFVKLSEGTKFRFGRAKVIWPSRKSVIQSKQDELSAKDTDFCPQPWLFNTVYGSRMGNEADGTADNDGFDYRGGGLIQLTGEGMHLLLLNWLHKQGKCLNLTIDTIDDWVKTEEGAIVSAIWFWLYKGCGVWARNDDVVKNTIAINGGKIGLEDEDGTPGRRSLVAKYKKLLNV